MARPITGEEEGAFAFLTLNHTAKRLALEGKEGGSDVSRGLLGLVEVGGASTQIVFPLIPYVHVPPFVRRVPVGAEAHLGSRRNLELVSVSFLQLGATSSAGLLLKNICNRPENIKQGICNNPCFPRGYEQSCSAGTPTITKDGQVTISTSTRDNRLKPVALFCASSNPEVSLKALNKLACKANGLDPAATLGERLSFPGCNKIVGTGDFQQCYAAVEQFLVSPQLPVPSNSEASASGFDSVGQVFRLASSDAPIYVTGGALVSAVRTLQSYNLLSRDFKGDVDELVRGAQRFCAIPVRKVSGSGLVFDIKGSAPLPVTAFSHDTCQKLALSASLLRHMNIGESRPEYVRFEDRILDRTGKAIGEYSWHVGAILQYALAKRKWARDMYELGSGFNLPSTAA
ncbi:gda1 cd39 (nucleoside phosphatase) family protein [Cystoisospora suis]|uniref:Gda1 cd39 (Nucleoside phosphatase) family protein n=1 Tax=Cystoisospora suis TaxID=483139 RepID=A0A2C6L4R0_9APIC|nr:gda1 cd39 (nucleoside phosphatase) family protein [Cystoisospora suis]